MAPAKTNPPGDGFGQTRRHICLRPPGDGDNLLGMEIDFCAYLGDPAYADDDPLCGKGMEVGSASGGAALVTRHARGTREDAPRLAQP
jgi:hypothetical protein